jgi:hypothetical protein
MNHLRLVPGACLLVAACAQQFEADVRLELRAHPGMPAPDALSLSWQAPDGSGRRDVHLAVQAREDLLAVVYIRTVTTGPARRMARAVATQSGQPVGEGTVELDVGNGPTSAILVVRGSGAGDAPAGPAEARPDAASPAEVPPAGALPADAGVTAQVSTADASGLGGPAVPADGGTAPSLPPDAMPCRALNTDLLWDFEDARPPANTLS